MIQRERQLSILKLWKRQRERERERDKWMIPVHAKSFLVYIFQFPWASFSIWWYKNCCFSTFLFQFSILHFLQFLFFFLQKIIIFVPWIANYTINHVDISRIFHGLPNILLFCNHPVSLCMAQLELFQKPAKRPGALLVTNSPPFFFFFLSFFLHSFILSFSSWGSLGAPMGNII